MGIYLDLSLVSLYPSQITLYKSLHVHWQSILEFTIREISYLDFLLIITGVEAGYVLLRKKLDIVGSSMDTWQTGWTEHIDSGRQKVNDSIPG